jgi:hypothetical protein
VGLLRWSAIIPDCQTVVERSDILIYFSTKFLIFPLAIKVRDDYTNMSGMGMTSRRMVLVCVKQLVS